MPSPALPHSLSPLPLSFNFPPSLSPLSSFYQEKLQLQKELKELQDKIKNLAKEDHTFAFKFGFIQNNSQPAAAINESAPAHTTANEPTPTHFKDSMKHVAANHAKEGVVGEGRGGKREGVQEDTRPIYEQLDIIGNEVEEKQTGGIVERGMNNYCDVHYKV